jgi:hypothetical protein
MLTNLDGLFTGSTGPTKQIPMAATLLSPDNDVEMSRQTSSIILQKLTTKLADASRTLCDREALVKELAEESQRRGAALQAAEKAHPHPTLTLLHSHTQSLPLSSPPNIHLRVCGTRSVLAHSDDFRRNKDKSSPFVSSLWGENSRPKVLNPPRTGAREKPDLTAIRPRAVQARDQLSRGRDDDAARAAQAERELAEERAARLRGENFGRQRNAEQRATIAAQEKVRRAMPSIKSGCFIADSHWHGHD